MAVHYGACHHGPDLQMAELGSPLSFPDGTFEDVTASLVLHYLEDWGRR